MNTTINCGLTEEQSHQLYIAYAYAIFAWVYISLSVLAQCILPDSEKEIKNDIATIKFMMASPRLLPYNV